MVYRLGYDLGPGYLLCPFASTAFALDCCLPLLPFCPLLPLDSRLLNPAKVPATHSATLLLPSPAHLFP
jgi:hypothetical protein